MHHSGAIAPRERGLMFFHVIASQRVARMRAR
jgi:hypothetical protein